MDEIPYATGYVTTPTTNDMRVIDDIFGWDVKSWSHALDFWDAKLAVDYPQCRALELGSGKNGGLSLWLALKGCDVLCSGYQRVPSEAKEIHSKHGVADFIEYADIDARSIPYTDTFDIVAYKSILGGIVRDESFDMARTVVNEVYNSLRPGGVLLFAENLSASRLHQILRHQHGSGANLWRYFTVDELQNLHSRFSKLEYMVSGFLGCFGRNERQRTILGVLDRYIFNSVVPSRWKYIFIGLATK